MTTNLTKIFDEIESNQFSAELNLASGYKMFLDIMNKNATFNLLCSMVSGTGLFNGGCDAILERIKEIVNADFDKKYENPYDVALATYVLVLLKVDRKSGICAAQLISDEHQTWWANQVIQRLYDSTSSIGL